MEFGWISGPILRIDRELWTNMCFFSCLFPGFAFYYLVVSVWTPGVQNMHLVKEGVQFCFSFADASILLIVGLIILVC